MAIFDEITCYKCGVIFGVPSGHRARLMESKDSFWCPNGHSQCYTESTSDKLRRERDRLAQRIAQKDDEIAAAKKEAAALKGKITKLHNRAKAGLCSCCNRHFTNLERHMASKHKEAEAA